MTFTPWIAYLDSPLTLAGFCLVALLATIKLAKPPLLKTILICLEALLIVIAVIWAFRIEDFNAHKERDVSKSGQTIQQTNIGSNGKIINNSGTGTQYFHFGESNDKKSE